MTNPNSGNNYLAAGTAGALSAVANINVAGYPSSNPVFVGGFKPLETGSTDFFYYDQIGNTGLWFIEASVSNGLFASGIPGIHLTESCGNDVANLVPAHVPEPGTMVLLGSGLVGLAGWMRKKFRK